MKDKEEMFIKVYESNKDRIYRICNYYVSDRELVHDLYQEIFINVWKNLDSFRREANINTWIYRIAINTSINYARILHREARFKSYMDETKHIDVGVQEETPDDTESHLRLLQKSIDQLSLSEKTLISLVMEELSYKEIAEICDISEGLLRVRVHRIKKKIKARFKEIQHEV